MGLSLDLRSLSPFHRYFLQKRRRFGHCRGWVPAPTQGSQTHELLRPFQVQRHLEHCVDLWVRFATTAKVDQLSLRLSASHLKPCENDIYKLPQNLYADEFVSELDFHFCKIKPNGLVGWSSLKRLCIGFAAMSEDVINKVLMGSPILEFLKLQNCYKFSRFDTLSESLRKLVMDTCISKVKLQC